MKCNNCGAECNENQVFCLECGTPVYSEEILKDEEVSLEGNISEESANDSMFEESADDNMPKEVDVDISLQDFEEMKRQQEIEAKKQMQIQMQMRKKRQMLEQKRREVMRQEALAKQQQQENLKKQKKAARRKIIGMIFGFIIILGIGIFVASMIKKCSTGQNQDSFMGYYTKGVEYLDNQQYDKALTELLKANKIKKTDSSVTEQQEVDLKIALWKGYTHVAGKDVEAIAVLKELLEIDPDNVEYYDSLIQIYQDTSRTDALEELLAQLEETPIANQLEYYKLDAPIPDTDEGEYNYYFSVRLSSEDNAKIYYKLYEEEIPSETELEEIQSYDAAAVKENLTKYKKSIHLGQDTTYTLIAIAISDREIPSYMMKKTYTLELDVISGPEVTPDSGDYTENTKIEVEVPDGCKVYYTFGDDVKPTKKSTQYKEPIDMPRGNSCFNVIMVNENGKKSEVVTKVYNLSIPRNIDFETADSKVKKYYVATGKAKDTEGNRKGGGKIDVNYTSTEVIDNEEYYVFEVQFVKKDGTVSKTEYQGVNTDDGYIYPLVLKDDVVSSEDAETTENEETSDNGETKKEAEKTDAEKVAEQESEIYNGQNSIYKLYEEETVDLENQQDDELEETKKKSE